MEVEWMLLKGQPVVDQWQIHEHRRLWKGLTGRPGGLSGFQELCPAEECIWNNQVPNPKPSYHRSLTAVKLGHWGKCTGHRW
jgi:hypothetical protein